METLNIRAADLGEVLPLLRRTEAPGIDTTLGSANARELCARGACFAVECGGALVGAYSLMTVEHESAAVVWVIAAAGHRPGADLTQSVMPVIEAQAREAGAAQVAISTRRRGLIQKLTAQGYELAGVTLRKKIQ